MFSRISNNLKYSTFNKIISKGFKQKLGFKEEISSRPLGYTLLGLGIGGLGYLTYTNMNNSAQHTKSLIAGGSTVGKDISLKRTKDTLLYFAGGICMTSLMTAGMLRNPTILRWSMGWHSFLITLPTSLYLIYKIQTVPPTKENEVPKAFFWLGFNACMAFSLTPMIAMSELVMVRDAFIVTSGAFGGLSLIAANSRDDAFLGMSGLLGAGLGGICAIGIANIFLQSHALFNIWLYGGLALFLAFVMYDMKKIQVAAKTMPNFDPMSSSLSIYLDFVNIFIRILFIMQNQKKK